MNPLASKESKCLLGIICIKDAVLGNLNLCGLCNPHGKSKVVTFEFYSLASGSLVE